MTKKDVIQFLTSHGIKCSYCGHAKIMWVHFNTGFISNEDISIAVAQHFGITPDFTIKTTDK